MIEFKVSNVIGACMVFVFANLVSSQDYSEDLATDRNRRRTVPESVSNLIADLGDLFLETDRAFAVIPQRKVEHEDNIISQIFRPTTDYFDRIQKNYRDVQRRLGRFLGSSLGYKNNYSDRELSTVSPPLVTTEEDEVVSTTTPVSNAREDYNPFAAADKERTGKLKVSGASVHHVCSNKMLNDPVLESIRKEECARISAEKARSDFTKLVSDSRKISSALLPASSKALDELSKGLLRSLEEISNDYSDAPFERSSSKGRNDETSFIPTDECFTEVLGDPTHERLRKKKCLRLAKEEQIRQQIKKIIENSLRARGVVIPGSSEAIDQLSTSFVQRSGDVAASESLFDKHVRKLFEDHGNWFLDNPLLSIWKQPSEDSTDISTEEESSEAVETTSTESISETTEAATETTELFLPTSTENRILSKSGESLNENLLKSSYYKIVNDNGEIVQEEVDIVFEPDSLSQDIGIEVEKQEPQDTVILAFTSDGVPLKLRMGPEIDNPLRYLHKVLKSAGVSLNIPVESYDDLDPVGKEVLKLGSGILTRAVLIDVSNNNELKSLLKALMTAKASGKTTY